jgi:uncharacterized membrane protein YoaK (UPF0700 family)
VMTGNMVLLGISAGRLDGELAGHTGAAILCFVLGCAVGARVAGTAQKGDAVWPVAITWALALEGGVLVVYAILWWLNDSAPTGGLQLVLLVLNAFALGLQSSTIQRFGVPGLSTTYMTGTLTTVVMKLASGRHPREVGHSGSILLALVVGAAAATVLVRHWAVGAPLLQLAGVGIAILLGWSAARVDRAGEPAPAGLTNS